LWGSRLTRGLGWSTVEPSLGRGSRRYATRAATAPSVKLRITRRGVDGSGDPWTDCRQRLRFDPTHRSAHGFLIEFVIQLGIFGSGESRRRTSMRHRAVDAARRLAECGSRVPGRRPNGAPTFCGGSPRPGHGEGTTMAEAAACASTVGCPSILDGPMPTTSPCQGRSS